MSGKEILLKAIRNELTPRPAWLPFVGVHGASLIGVKAPEYLKSASMMGEGLEKANALYQPDGLPVVFDLQLEAEVLGCELNWPEETPPSVVSHPLSEGADLKSLPAFDTSAGRFPIVAELMERLKKSIGDDTALYGLICGPFTLALHLLGTNIFLEMFDHPDYVKAVSGLCASIGKKTAEFYINNGADIVGVVDPMTSQIGPAQFDDFVAPYLNDIFDFIKNRNAYSSLFVCGDASRNMQTMGRTRCDNISIDENIPLDYVRNITRSTGKSFGGNMKLTSVLLFGDEDDCRLDAIRCIDVGGECGFILAPGCDLPFSVPPANIQAVTEMVQDSYQRQVAKRTIVAKSATDSKTELPDYKTEKDVFVDVVTLDSSSCAPCKYMMDAVHNANRDLERPVVVREHRISTRRGLAVMTKLGVKNIPTICIDGEVAFSSIIPDRKTLVARLDQSVKNKG